MNSIPSYEEFVKSAPVGQGPAAIYKFGGQQVFKMAYSVFSDEATCDPQVFYERMGRTISVTLKQYFDAEHQPNATFKLIGAFFMAVMHDVPAAYTKARMDNPTAPFETVRTAFLHNLNAEFDDSLETAMRLVGNKL